MEIRISNHAQQRIKERHISDIHIQQTLESPDSKTERAPTKFELRKKFLDKELEIIVVISDSYYLIITATIYEHNL